MIKMFKDELRMSALYETVEVQKRKKAHCGNSGRLTIACHMKFLKIS